MRGQIEYVVLHYPGRDYEQGLRVNLLRHGTILNQLHQPVAKNHPARRDANVCANAKSLSAGRFLPIQRPFSVLEKIHPALYQIGAVLLTGYFQYLGICQNEIGRRKHIEQLAHCEGDHVFIMA